MLVESSALKNPSSLLASPSGLSQAQGEAQSEGQCVLLGPSDC